MKYRRKSFEGGGKVTKDSVFKQTRARIDKELPNNKISDDDVRTASMVYLLSGLRPEVLDKQIAQLKKKA